MRDDQIAAILHETISNALFERKDLYLGATFRWSAF